MSSKPFRIETRNDSLSIEEMVQQENGEQTIKRYFKGKYLGTGGFAQCYELTEVDSMRTSAAKIISKSSLAKRPQNLKHEIEIHSRLHHPHIVEFEHYFEDSVNVYILLELCSNQSLNDLLRRRKRLTEIEVKCYGLQIIEAVKYLHSQRIIHRDLKLCNILLTENMQAKVSDFGLASHVPVLGEKRRTVCGTPYYMPPEMVLKHNYSFEVDVWAIGIIVYAMLIGRTPFEHAETKFINKMIRENRLKLPQTISSRAKNFIKRILVTDPLQRPKIDALASDEFFSEPVPRVMPESTLACPPSNAFLRQYIQTTKPYSTEKRQIPKSAVVKNWVKTGRHGLGYLLTNGGIGVCFGENTLCFLNNKIAYREKGRELDYSENDTPHSLEQKLASLNHVASLFGSHNKNCRDFVCKFFETKHAVFIMLSNRAVQVVFNDTSQVVISNDKMQYFNTQQVQEAFDMSNSDILKRLSVIKRTMPDLIKV